MSPHDRPIDLIIQRSTLELLESYGVAAAPQAALKSFSSKAPGEFAGMARFSAPGLSGALMLSIPTTMLTRTTRSGMNQTASLLDWIRELTNQLMGRFKNKLSRYQLLLRVELPTASSAASLERRFAPLGGAEREYRFRTLTEDVVVRLRGQLDDSNLVYSSTAEMLGEGDVVLF